MRKLLLLLILFSFTAVRAETTVPSGIICVKDANNNGVLDPGEWQDCIKADDGSNFCPIDMTPCTPDCPAGASFNSTLNKCTAAPTAGTCKAYYSLFYIIYQCSIDGRVYQNLSLCEANCKTCPDNMTYDPVFNTCVSSPSYSCPLGDYECKDVDGQKYCSAIECQDFNSTSEAADTPVGINDKQDDGTVDSNGNCLGTIYIFNGHDMRCRLPGIETAWTNCCNDYTYLLGLLSCTDDEVKLASYRDAGIRDGRCHEVGEYCADKLHLPWGGYICLQKKRTYCCFNSVLAKVFQEQARQQLGISWGTPEYPNCRGLTPQEFQKVDVSKMDLSEVYSDIEKKVQDGIIKFQTDAQNQINDYIQKVTK
ncbi:conjugal transfer protein TraN [Desulfurobacterium sp.]